MGPKIHARMDEQDEKIAEHDQLFDGNPRADPPVNGVIKDVYNIQKRVTFTDKILAFTGLSAFGALLSIWWKNIFKGG